MPFKTMIPSYIMNLEGTVGSSCTPFVKMNSTTFSEANQECHNNPSCSMFFDKCGTGTDWNFCMHTGTEVQTYMNLHKKGSAAIIYNS